MTMLSINHGAKGIIMWAFPTTPELTDVTSKLAKVLTGACAKYLLGAELLGGPRINGADTIDASMWRVENSLLVSIVNSAHQDTTGSVTVNLPDRMIAMGIASVLWGDGKWRLTNVQSATHIQRSGLQSMSTDILLVNLEAQQAVDEQTVLAEY